MKSIRRYLRTLCPLLMLLGAYRLLIVPFLEPKIYQQTKEWKATPASYSPPWWTNYFNEGSWERNPGHVVKTKDGLTLLFGEFEKLEANRYKLFPLTILLQQSGRRLENEFAKSRLTIIENREGAVIEFGDAFDIASGKPPAVSSGTMSGLIRIASPATKADGSDALHMEMHDLNIGRRKIWTSNSVYCRMGASEILGKDLSIQLDQDLLDSSPENSSQNQEFQGLDSMELTYVERVTIALPPGGLWPSKTIGNLEHSSTSVATLNVHCAGSFRFDFHSSMAQLQRDVKMIHRVSALPDDQFTCDDLLMHIDWGNESTSPSSQRGFQIDRIEARGRLTENLHDPTARWVRVDAPNIDSKIQARWLRIDLKQGKIALSNHLPEAIQYESTPVFLQREHLTVWSPKIEYQNTDLLQSNATSTGGTNRPTRLGKLNAAGPGIAQMLADSGDSWRLSWAKQLLIEPVTGSDTDQDLLTIDGSANASSEVNGRFRSDFLRMWLIPTPLDLAAKMRRDNPSARVPIVLPDRIHAQNQVNIETTQVAALVEDMQLYFVYPKIVNPPIGASESPASNSDSLNLGESHPRVPQAPTASSMVHQPRPVTPSPRNLSTFNPQSPQVPDGFLRAGSPENQPIGSGLLASTGNDAGLSLPPAMLTGITPRKLTDTTSPWNVTGNKLIARIIYDAKQSIVDDLQIDENVTLTRDQISPANPMPLTMTGNHLRLSSAGRGNAEVGIVGLPALVKIGTGSMTGPEIRFSEQDQRLWINHPGAFILPTELVAATSHGRNAVPSLLGGPDGSWIEAPRIDWDGAMEFDGKTARLRGGIRLKGRYRADADTIWHIEGNANELDMHLTHPVMLGTNRSSHAQVEDVVLNDQVDIRASQTNLRGDRRSHVRIALPKLTMRLTDQTFAGTGPGWIRTKQLELPSRDLAKVRGNVPQFQCLHMTYWTQIAGSIAKKEARLVDRVEGLFGSIANWDESLDVQNARQLELDQSHMSCDVLHMYSTADLSWNQRSQATLAGNSMGGLAVPDAWEMKARGNVTFERLARDGRLQVEASEAQYVANQSELTILGEQRRPATFQIQRSDGQVLRDNLIATMVVIDTLTMQPKKLAVVGATITPPANMQPPGIDYSVGQTPQANPIPLTPAPTLPSPRYNPRKN